MANSAAPEGNMNCDPRTVQDLARDSRTKLRGVADLMSRFAFDFPAADQAGSLASELLKAHQEFDTAFRGLCSNRNEIDAFSVSLASQLRVEVRTIADFLRD